GERARDARGARRAACGEARRAEGACMSGGWSPGGIRLRALHSTIPIPRNDKGAPRDALFANASTMRYASALIACASRDFVREARFLCTIRLSAMRSITACDSRNVAAAAALSPAAIAFLTFLTAVRSADFWLALRWRVVSACRARLRACAVFAILLRFLIQGNGA